MKSIDTQLLEEAYEKVLHDKGHQSIEELTKEIDALKEKCKKAEGNNKTQLEKIIKAKMDKRAKMVGKK